MDRERKQLVETRIITAARGVHDVVRQHYNAVPERGRGWRKTDSRIKGLRSFNNWVKSTIIQKFSPNENFTPGGASYGGQSIEQEPQGLLVLDIGCGKGGDLGKWQQAPQPVDLYVGVDPAEVSIEQAQERYGQMRGGGGGRRGGRSGFRGGRPHQSSFEGKFFAKDCFGEWLGDIPIIREVGIDGNIGPGGGGNSRWGGGGFDVVSMMFCMHYAFESEAKARGMLRNVAGSLKKGGRFLGVIPNSDILRAKVQEFHQSCVPKETTDSKLNRTETNKDIDSHTDDEVRKDLKAQTESDSPKDMGSDKDTTELEKDIPTPKNNTSLPKPLTLSEPPTPEWGNSIYRVKFPPNTPSDGIFRPPFGWKYSYFLEEAVEEVPEYVVPWEAFRALAEDYNLELQYRKPFADVWKEEKDDAVLGPLSERMGVRERGRGDLLVSGEEMEAAGFYLAFCFYKV